jgi:hypothetical protein
MVFLLKLKTVFRIARKERFWQGERTDTRKKIRGRVEGTAPYRGA